MSCAWRRLIEQTLDSDLQIQLLTQSHSSFSKEDLEDMEGLYDEELINKLYQL